ncbi:MAG: inner membrane protein YpjD [Opitutaceae bacterium]
MLTALTDRNWLWVAAGFYLAGFLQGTVSLVRQGKPAGAATYVLILLGYAAQLAGLALRGRAVGGCPLGNPLEIYQFTAWSTVTLYLVVGATFRLSLLGYFSACLAATLTLASLAIPGWDSIQRVRIFGTNPWIEFHAALAVFSYGVFALLALTSVMYLLRNHSLRSKRLGGWFSFLPSIRDLDQIGLRLLGAGTVILAIALAVGSVHWLRIPGFGLNAKILVTYVVWVAATVAFTLRLRGALLAQRFAWTCLGLFLAAMLSLLAVESSRAPAPTPTVHHAGTGKR